MWAMDWIQIPEVGKKKLDNARQKRTLTEVQSRMQMLLPNTWKWAKQIYRFQSPRFQYLPSISGIYSKGIISQTQWIHGLFYRIRFYPARMATALVTKRNTENWKPYFLAWNHRSKDIHTTQTADPYNAELPGNNARAVPFYCIHIEFDADA